MGRAHVGAIAQLVAGNAQLDGRIDSSVAAPEPAVDLADVMGQSHARFASRSPPPAPIT